jgi:hypothetical protein
MTPDRDTSGGNRVILWQPGTLRSLWDMVTVSAEKYVNLGHWLEGVRMSFMFYDADSTSQDNEGRVLELRNSLKELIKACEELGLSRAQDLVSHAYDDLPQSRREWELLLRAVMADIRKTVFLFIPEHLAKYYDMTFPGSVTAAFPMASKELIWAGNTLACGQYTASVFHSMRAAEIGVRVFGKELTVTWSFLISQSNWLSGRISWIKPILIL